MIRKSKLFVLIALSCMTISSLLFQSCEKDELLMSKDEKRDAVYELAKTYNLNIEIKDGISNDSIFNVNSLSEIENVFRIIAKEREKEQVKSLNFKNNKGNMYLYKSNTNLTAENGVRLKSATNEGGGFLSGLKEWFYDLTWFNTSVKYEKDSTGKITNVEVKSYYTGASFYDYEQINSATRVSNDTIYFQTQGKESGEYGFWGMTITESRNINTSGYIDTKTGNGEINTGGNGYWGN